MKQKNNIKLIGVICTLIIIFLVFLYFYLSSQSYSLVYTVNDVKITEKYDKNKKYYSFNLEYKDINYDLLSLDKYTNKRRLIQSITIEEQDNGMCLLIKSSLVELYSICYRDGKYFTYYYNHEVGFKEKDSYQNIQINDYNNNNYLFWNYNGFLYLSENKKKKIELFDRDIYNMNLYYQTDDYLIIPNYSDDYYYKSIYLINLKNGKVSSFDLRFDISFDSYFIGDYDNKVYLYDIKNEVEYYLDLKKKDIYKTDYKVMEYGKFVLVSNQKLKNNKLRFTNNIIFNYYIENNNLLLNNMLIDSGDDIIIVKQEGKNLYYIKGNILFYFNPSVGKKALFKYSEWNFNRQNMVFVN